MNRNYGNKRDRVGIRRFDGKEEDKWDLLITGENMRMNRNNGNKKENVGAGGYALEYNGKKGNIWANVRN